MIPFIIGIIIIFIYMIYQKDSRIKIQLENTLENNKKNYDITYTHFKQLSENTFYGLISKKIIFDNVKNSQNKDAEIQNLYRNKLYDEFHEDYLRLKAYDINLVHFHLKNNISFLRMHMPNYFGDNLNAFRKSVVQANLNLFPQEGFEIGKQTSAIRFVYPLFDENLLHLGSAELSVTSDSFESYFEKQYAVDTHFLIKNTASKTNLLGNYYNQLISPMLASVGVKLKV